ncbi:hypothetical protein [Falsiroseomonas sp. E2-1-a20]|uniref:hypothetical protein n=1 Tax=Falsiroseomonas sp. E2-1-a20 TaxID=3239300 RepID=UPI003F2C8FFF
MSTSSLPVGHEAAASAVAALTQLHRSLPYGLSAHAETHFNRLVEAYDSLAGRLEAALARRHASPGASLALTRSVLALAEQVAADLENVASSVTMNRLTVGLRLIEGDVAQMTQDLPDAFAEKTGLKRELASAQHDARQLTGLALADAEMQGRAAKAATDAILLPHDAILPKAQIPFTAFHYSSTQSLL